MAMMMYEMTLSSFSSPPPQQQQQQWLSNATVLLLAADPLSFYNTCFYTLLTVVVVWKTFVFQQQRAERPDHHGPSSTEKRDDNKKKAAAPSTTATSAFSAASRSGIRIRFLSVFWLLRMSFWMSGPYFYPVYAEKTVNGQPASISFMSAIFLMGYGSIALCSPFVERFLAPYGPKTSLLVAALLATYGSVSTKFTQVPFLFLGRAVGGVGTNILTTAPEAWLVSALLKKNKTKNSPSSTSDIGSSNDEQYLADTFGIAFGGDFVAAILAGQVARWAADRRGPTGPFEIGPLFLALGSLLCALFWTSSKGSSNATTAEQKKNDDDEGATDASGKQKSKRPSSTIKEALVAVFEDEKIVLVGAISSLFEAAMNIFVLQWAPILEGAVHLAYGASASPPYGTVFSCFMAACLLGATVFSHLVTASAHDPSDKSTSSPMTPAFSVERSTTRMLSISCTAVAISTIRNNKASETSSTTTAFANLCGVTIAFFVFEGCVGWYFPSIGTLRSKYLPENHRTMIMTLFSVPLNCLVAGVLLCNHMIGPQNAMRLAALALFLAALCMARLSTLYRKDLAQKRWSKLARAVRETDRRRLLRHCSRDSFQESRRHKFHF